MRRSWTAGILDIGLNAAPGVAVALILGWGPVGASLAIGLLFVIVGVVLWAVTWVANKRENRSSEFSDVDKLDG